MFLCPMPLRLSLLLALVTATSSGSCEAQAASTRAWFLDYTWTPNQDSVAGLSVRAIRSDWDDVLPLTPALFPSMSPADSAEVRDYTWALGGDLNQDGVPDSVLTGVFAGKQGSGRFLLVLSRTGTVGWQPVFSHVTSDGPRFSALSVRDGKVYWMLCMSCGNQYLLVPGARGYKLVYKGD
jgi:hypothetical protein